MKNTAIIKLRTLDTKDSPKIMSHLNTEVFQRIKGCFNVFFTVREMIIQLNMRLFQVQKGYFKIALKLPS